MLRIARPVSAALIPRDRAEERASSKMGILSSAESEASREVYYWVFRIVNRALVLELGLSAQSSSSGALAGPAGDAGDAEVGELLEDLLFPEWRAVRVNGC